MHHAASVVGTLQLKRELDSTGDPELFNKVLHSIYVTLSEDSQGSGSILQWVVSEESSALYLSRTHLLNLLCNCSQVQTGTSSVTAYSVSCDSALLVFTGIGFNIGPVYILICFIFLLLFSLKQS